MWLHLRMLILDEGPEDPHSMILLHETLKKTTDYLWSVGATAKGWVIGNHKKHFQVNIY